MEIPELLDKIMANSESIMIWIFRKLIWVGYFIPSIIAFRNKKEKKWSILLWNLLFSWTIIGWFISLSHARRENIHTHIDSDHIQKRKNFFSRLLLFLAWRKW